MKNTEILLIENDLASLNYIQSLSFGYMICKKLFPDYANFSEYEDYGRPDILYSGLIALRKHIAGFDNIHIIKQLINQFWEDNEITPDTDDFPGNLSASLALNSVSALYHCLKYSINKEQNLILRVSDLSLESVIMYFVTINNIDQNLHKDIYSKLISGSELVKAEIKLQKKLIAKIKEINQIDRHLYIQIKPTDNKLVEFALNLQLACT